MTQIAEQVRLAAGHPDGGVEVVALGAGDPVALFRQAAPEISRSGFVPVLASQEAAGALPQVLLHRHLLVICAGEGGRRVAVHWVRRLAQTSPRRHLVVTFGAAATPRPGLERARAAADVVSARVVRAERWRRRGRSRMAERWLVAAAEAARRRGDTASAAVVEAQIIGGLLDADRIAEAGRRVRVVLREDLDWPAYATAGALFADVLIAREQFATARAWVSSLTAEADLRGETNPAAIGVRIAELDFWQGRSASDGGAREGLSDPDEAGWRAVRAWSCGDLAQVAALSVRLEGWPGDGARPGYWFALLRVLLAGTAGEAEIARRISELVRVGVHGDAVSSRRRRRLAAVVAARALFSQQTGADAVALLESVRGPGPEGTVCRRLTARTPGGDAVPTSPRTRARRIDAPGVACLSSGSRDMHLVDGLSGLLSVIEDANDEAGVLMGGCKWMCRQAGASGVAIVSADRATLVAAEGWRRADLAGEIGEILDGSARDARLPDQDATAGGFGVSVRYGGVTTGYVVVRGRPSDRPALQQAAQALAALCGSALRARLDLLTASRRARQSIPEIVGDSPLMEAVRDAVTRAATAPFPVLIEGGSGTGKELVARALHRLGPRRDHRFSAVNCAALNDELVEAELFGHARGAFTGAVGPRAGLFEDADGGTLFLDEVTELSPRAQAKLLRVLQEREVRRVGENHARAINVRIIAACNVPMAEAVASGRFRDDLRFRLAVVRIGLPLLRERVEDLPALAHLFWRRAAAEAGTRALLGADALARLTRHSWPGNVRELQNVLAGLVVAAPACGRVGARHVEQVLSHVTAAADMPGVRLEAARRTFERRVITAALVRHAGRRAAAATELGLTRQGLTKAMRRLGLAPDEDAAGVA